MENKPAFVEAVRPLSTQKTTPLMARLLIGGWLLIAIKSVVIWWACAHYTLPFHPLWVIGPTVAFGSLCTGVYLYAKR